MATGDRYDGEWYMHIHILILLNVFNHYDILCGKGLVAKRMEKEHILSQTTTSMKDISKVDSDKAKASIHGWINHTTKETGNK